MPKGLAPPRPVAVCLTTVQASSTATRQRTQRRTRSAAGSIPEPQADGERDTQEEPDTEFEAQPDPLWKQHPPPPGPICLHTCVRSRHPTASEPGGVPRDATPAPDDQDAARSSRARIASRNMYQPRAASCREAFGRPTSSARPCPTSFHIFSNRAITAGDSPRRTRMSGCVSRGRRPRTSLIPAGTTTVVPAGCLWCERRAAPPAPARVGLAATPGTATERSSRSPTACRSTRTPLAYGIEPEPEAPPVEVPQSRPCNWAESSVSVTMFVAVSLTTV